MSRSDFLSFLKNEKRYSAHTIKAYESDLEQFANYLKEFYEIDNLAEANEVK